MSSRKLNRRDLQRKISKAEKARVSWSPRTIMDDEVVVPVEPVVVERVVENPKVAEDAPKPTTKKTTTKNKVKKEDDDG